MIQFDVLLPKLGYIGLFQFLVFILLAYFNLVLGFSALATVFIAYKPHFRCSAPVFEDSSLYPNLTENEIRNLTTPFDPITKTWDYCRRYGYNMSGCHGDFSCVNKSADVIGCDVGYHYDKSMFTETVITEFDLVCDRQFFNALSTSMYYVGMLFGSILFGNAADKYGRKQTAFVAYLGCLSSMFIVTYSTNVYLYMVFRALTATFGYGATIGTYVYIMEIVGDRWRTYLGFAYQYYFAICYMLQSVIAYQWRNWHDFMLVCSLLSAPWCLVILFMPESPRWLLANNKEREGRRVVELMSRLNKVKLREQDWIDAQVPYEGKTEERSYSTFDLFRLPKTRILSFNLMYCWFANSFVYYGVALNAGSLAGNLFINNTLSGALEVVAYTACMWSLNRIGRRLSLSIALLVAGFGLIISLVILEFAGENQTLITLSVVFAFIGKFGISASFSIAYNVTAELYPTVTRSNAIGIGSAAARLGGIIAPFVIWLQDYIRWLPNTIFGITGIIAGVLAFTFPETKGCELMETLEEAEQFYKTKTQKVKIELREIMSTESRLSREWRMQ